MIAALGHTDAPDRALDLQGYGVAFGERVVLSSVDMVLPKMGVTALLGPAGTGKSTLQRTLAGFNDANPSLRTWGEARLAGLAVGATARPALVCQSARMITASVLDNLVHGLASRADDLRGAVRVGPGGPSPVGACGTRGPLARAGCRSVFGLAADAGGVAGIER